MCDKELIVGYLYDELPAADRRTLEAHVSVCAECRVELEELQTTRRHLTLWAPPEPELGFRVIRGGAAPAQALPRRRLLPAFAFAAAAVIVLAAAASLANIEVRYGDDGMTVRTGWARQAMVSVPGGAFASRDQAAAVTTISSSEEFAALDRRLRELEATIASNREPRAQTASATRLSDAELLRRVREMVSDAEARHETAFAQRLLQVFRDFDNQRRADIALIQQGLGQYQGLTNAEIAQNRDMLNQFIRAATKQEK